MTRLLQSSMKPVLPVSMFGMGLSLRCGGREALCATEEAGARTEEIVAMRRSPGSRVAKRCYVEPIIRVNSCQAWTSIPAPAACPGFRGYARSA